MLDSSDKKFPQRWATVTELCEMGVNRTLIDHFIRHGKVWTLLHGQTVYYSVDAFADVLADDARARLGDDSAKSADSRLPLCNKTGNLHR